MNFLKVTWRDISSIFKNRFVRVSVIAIIIVPLLYSLLYLDAFWDPYARVKDMPVAVVNQDKGSTKDGEKVNYGQDLVDNLKEKQEVGWRFVTKKQAEDGVKGKDYYAMFIIPEDFSENALSSTKGKPVQAKILYSANEKRNFLAAQINGKVLDQLKSELTKSMSKEYVTAVFDSLYEIKDSMKKASDGSKELSEGIITANNGTIKLKDGVEQLNSNVPEMIDGVGQLLVGSNTLTSKLGELKTQVPTMVSGVNQLNDGAYQLKNGLYELNSQVPTMATGTQKLNEVYKTQIVPSTGKLRDGAAQLALGLGATKEGATQLLDAATKLNEGGALLTDASGKLNVGYSQMKTGISELKDAELLVVGNSDSPMFPKELLPYTTRKTFGKGGIKLNFLVNYGWEWDLGNLHKNESSKRSNIFSCIKTNDISRVDLIIRWGGRRRLSGFLPLQSIYSDFYVIDDFWPDFKPEHLSNALNWYNEQDVTLGG